MKKIQVYLGVGCFWGGEAYFKTVEDIISTEVGYANGITSSPSYEEVCNGNTNFAEVVKLEFKNIETFNNILEHYFSIINPFTRNRQGNDFGTQYRSLISSDSWDVLELAKKYIKKEQKKYPIRKIAVIVEPLKNYFKAEEYHQNYLDKNPNGYCHIKIPGKVS